MSGRRESELGLTGTQAAVVLAVGVGFALAVLYRVGQINGFPEFTNWEWRWRNLGNFNTARVLVGPFLLISWVLWKIEQGWRRVGVLLGLLTLANFLMQVLGMLADPRGLGLVRLIVESDNATGYFSDALAIRDPLEWIRNFPSDPLQPHSAIHPAGPILFYYVFVKLFGPAAGAMAGGLGVGLAGSAGVAVMYKFSELWTTDQRTRLVASAFYALLPALIVFLPEFDQIYPIFSMLLIWCWVKGRGVYTGVALFAATFFAYNLLVLGAFLVYYGVYRLWRENWRGAAWMVLIRTSAIALGTCLGLYLILWLTLGYNPPRAFMRSLEVQAGILAYLKRPYSTFLIFDLYDFALGAGVMIVPLVLFRLTRRWGQGGAERHDIALTLIGLASILTVDLSGLLPGEAARVWMFLQPLWVAPAAQALAGLAWRWQLAMFVTQWWIVVFLKAKMSFVEP